jgi:hypothetical protein
MHSDMQFQYVWYVVGDEDMLLFAYKNLAEEYARRLFPEENPDARYSRIKFKTVHYVV